MGARGRPWRLSAVGIHTLADLEQVGAVVAFRIVIEAGYGATANLLYALDSTVRGIDWRALTPEDRARLREQAGLG